MAAGQALRTNRAGQPVRGTRAALVLLLIGAIATGADSGDDVDAIRDQRARSNAAIERHDADAVGAILDDDYVITISTGQIERSKDEHVKGFAEHFAAFPDVIYVRTPGEITISSAYPLAIEHGTWVGRRTTAGGPLEIGGEYTAAWRKTGDTWRIYSELFVGLYCKGADC